MVISRANSLIEDFNTVNIRLPERLQLRQPPLRPYQAMRFHHRHPPPPHLWLLYQDQWLVAFVPFSGELLLLYGISDAVEEPSLRLYQYSIIIHIIRPMCRVILMRWAPQIRLPRRID